MVKAVCPRLVIAGTGSGVGKTSLALGLARELARTGLRVQTFKVGPDFLDPTYLTIASGRTCYNLDGWMTSREYVRQLFAQATADADIALIEGVMGMFDGASTATLEGSTAEIAGWLDAPVLLVVNGHGAARSMAATVMGFSQFEPSVRVSGVIANQVGSQRHRDWLAESLAAARLCPLVGSIPRDGLPTLPSRHLGLVTADAENLALPILEQLADACRAHVEMPRLLDLARSAAPLEVEASLVSKSMNQKTRAAVGIARDEAFHFYYPDNLEVLAEAGVEWKPFSPLHDRELPVGLDGLYFGGGYPELYAAPLAENTSMLAAVRQFANEGGSIYAECGGLMYLGRSLATLDGKRHAMVDILPVDTAMLARRKSLGYAEAVMAADTLWGSAGQVCRGHEFHYSEITDDRTTSCGWQPAYTVQRPRAASSLEGFLRGNILASYIHLHWASRPNTIDHFLSHFGISQ